LGHNAALLPVPIVTFCTRRIGRTEYATHRLAVRAFNGIQRGVSRLSDMSHEGIHPLLFPLFLQ
jgi:hypothetical protein